MHNFQEVKLLTKHVCLALAQLHNAGIVHRDIRLENIVRDISGWYVLLDLELSAKPGKQEWHRQFISNKVELDEHASDIVYPRPRHNFRGDVAFLVALRSYCLSCI